MVMTQFEICKMYREAKNKKEQVKILCELNAEKRENIIAALLAGGIKHQELPRERKKKEAKAKTKFKVEAKGDAHEANEKTEAQRKEGKKELVGMEDIAVSVCTDDASKVSCTEKKTISIPSASELHPCPSKIEILKAKEPPPIIKNAVVFYIEHLHERINQNKEKIASLEIANGIMDEDIEDLKIFLEGYMSNEK